MLMVLIPVFTVIILLLLYKWATNKKIHIAWLPVSYAIKLSTAIGGVFLLFCIYTGLVEDVENIFWVFFLPKYTIIFTTFLFLILWGVSSIAIFVANQRNNYLRRQIIPAIAGSIFSLYISYAFVYDLVVTASLANERISSEYIEQKYGEYKDADNVIPLLAIANNSNTPPNILENLVNQKRPIYFKYYDSPLIKNYFGVNGSVLGFVAQNPKTQPKELEILASYDTPWLLQYASEFKDFPIKGGVYIKVASERIRRNVKGNPNTPNKILQKLPDFH
jgi:hypothetical protein